MSSPIHSLNPIVLNAVDLTSSHTSNILEIGEVGGYAVQSIFTGSPIGTLEVKGSNTLNLSDFITVDTYAVTSDGKRMLNVERAHYSYIIVVYTKTSGTGNLTCIVSAKEI